MKKLFILLFALLLGSQHTIGQGSGKLESFRETVLTGYNVYFTRADLTGAGKLSLAATDSYNALSADAKRTIMVSVTKAWNDSLVLVHYGSKREIWGRSSESGDIELLDVLDLNSAPMAIPVIRNAQLHPWFFYVGGQFGGDNQNNINLALNLRVGFYLLINRLDMATTFSAGVTGNTAATGAGSSSGWVNTGLMGRVHFPIKKLGLSPNVGGQLTVNLYGNTPATINAALLLGVSWYLGVGNLDIGISIGNIVSGSGGYTFSPQIKRN